MTRRPEGMWEEFRRHWKNYVFQSLLATLVIFFVVLVVSMQHAVIIASIGSTAFIVFAMPDSLTAQMRNVVGGHVIGLLCGAACLLIPQPEAVSQAAARAAAVGASIFLMVVTDTEHPPAAGTALGIAMSGVSVDATVAVVSSAILLSAAHRVWRPHLKDLT